MWKRRSGILTKVRVIACVYDTWKRGNDIENVLVYSPSFSDTISSELKLPPSGLAFISTNLEEINYIAKFRKSGRVATKIDRLSFTDVTELSSSINISNLIELVPNRFNKHIEKQISAGINNISPGVYSAIINVVLKNYPDIAEEIERFASELKSIQTPYKGNSAETIAFEKDAISLALRVSGFSNNDLPSWKQESDSAPFLNGFQNVVIREDPMVIHDSQVFGEWSKIKQYIVGAAEFTKGNNKLTIMNANRHKIEENLGVDLIIYHHKFKSYLLIQYKRMTKDGDTLSYRPNDKSYKSEISRMVKFQEKEVKDKQGYIDDYRLNNEFYYFKLCPAQITNPLSTEMIKGMYFPLSFWQILLKAKETEGVRTGRIINYKNTHRYINNTLFVELVQNGWLGSKLDRTELITSQITSAIKGKRSVILASYEPETT
ncbi:MAG: hypothetical protein ACI8ZB_005257 [Desulforhopalus sp.]